MKMIFPTRIFIEVSGSVIGMVIYYKNQFSFPLTTRELA